MLLPLAHRRLPPTTPAARNAPGNTGFVNITDLQGGKVGFDAVTPGSKLDSSYTKSVKQIPYNISVLHISAGLQFPCEFRFSNEECLALAWLKRVSFLLLPSNTSHFPFMTARSLLPFPSS
ncbi:hypothetical protein ACJRO7_020917 [Eucalyptus globulus]|uniref:Uncharacterized protein n=1 Tax=Eucalyptus globulus TaxID=34317 RepID=A0ABD3KJN4_EUCGL